MMNIISILLSYDAGKKKPPFSNPDTKAYGLENVMFFLYFPGEPTSLISYLFVCLATTLGARERNAATLP